MVLACGFLPDVLREALGEGSTSGVAAHATWPSPSRAAPPGAIRFAADELGDGLEDRFLALNGDVLTDLDLTALLRAHEERGARGDARPAPGRGLLRLRAGAHRRRTARSSSSLEKTGEREPGEINAGIYVLERSVLDLIPPGRERLDRARRLPAPGRRGPARAARSTATGWTSAPRSATCRRAGTSSRGGSRRGSSRPLRASSSAPAREVAAGARVGPRAVISPRLQGRPGARGPRIGPARRLHGRRGRPGQRLDPRAGVAVEPGAELDDAVVGRDERVPSLGLMIDDVLAIPDHLRDALWRIESARLEPAEAAGRAGLRDGRLGDRRRPRRGRARRPPDPAAVTVRGYALPSWATPEWTVLCSSYSGETEETLACFDAAEALGARRIVASTGGAAGRPGARGRRPGGRAARASSSPAPRSPTCSRSPPRSPRWPASRPASTPRSTPPPPSSPSRPRRCSSRAAEIAARLDGRLPVVYGADLTAPVARRWKTQVNENAKLPAFFSELPEADHNELCGWRGRRAAHRLAAVFLEDSRPAPARAPPLRADRRGGRGRRRRAVRVETAGETRVARLLWATMLGDLVSLELARARGVDPVPVEAIERFKEAMGQAGISVLSRKSCVASGEWIAGCGKDAGCSLCRLAKANPRTPPRTAKRRQGGAGLTQLRTLAGASCSLAARGGSRYPSSLVAGRQVGTPLHSQLVDGELVLLSPTALLSSRAKRSEGHRLPP